MRDRKEYLRQYNADRAAKAKAKGVRLRDYRESIHGDKADDHTRPTTNRIEVAKPVDE